jgi:hypothetical protein
MTADRLYRQALEAKASRCEGRKKRNLDRWLPAVNALRSKGWDYAAIWAWLKEQGEDVHGSRGSFTAAMSRRYMRWLAKQMR